MSPLAATPAGSQKPTGACTPRLLSRAHRGEVVSRAQFPQLEPARSSWKNVLEVRDHGQEAVREL
eukprot:6302903-Heterocapsa_arctica.AAC.1